MISENFLHYYIYTTCTFMQPLLNLTQSCSQELCQNTQEAVAHIKIHITYIRKIQAEVKKCVSYKIKCVVE